MTTVKKITAKTELELSQIIADMPGVSHIGKKEGFTNKSGRIVRWEQYVWFHPMFETMPGAEQYCREQFLKKESSFGPIVKNGYAHGGSEKITAPEGFSTLNMYAQYRRLNENGNPVTAVQYVHAFYKSK